ncbi:metallophosphoesterase family protein [Asticcacaulis tiandongensis]|uniref:metallophosphoesterase family protein n=1 Tax=Asticcacaulis tiandongensis TaxID=2565365 RepID=UPI00112B3239|nr:metallophosphoesterase [Asticcacaulis tiandongensis]
MIIAHISDLHFGACDNEIADLLLTQLNDSGADLIIASGDITQSATETEFIQARAFFDRLKAPVFVIPGNHDLPGIDFRRFWHPFERYKRHIAEDLNPVLQTGLSDIVGLNSARMILPHWNWANGSISALQRRAMRNFFKASHAPWRILVVHHPLQSPKEFPLDITVFNGQKLLKAIDESRIDLVLAGHQHHAYIESRNTPDHTTLFVSASTAMSTRVRRQPNGFNILHLSPDTARIDQLRLENGLFRVFSALTHTKKPNKTQASPLPAGTDALPISDPIMPH